MNWKIVFFRVTGVLLIFVISSIIFSRESLNYSYNVIEENNKIIEDINKDSYINVLNLNFISIFDWIKGIFGGDNSSNSNQDDVVITSNNVCKFIKQDTTGKKKVADYCSDNNLHAKIYWANKETNNWALLIHGNTMNGSQMYNAVGKMYIDNNINVLAIDLRGAGSSKGSVALGFLESLDVMDWLDYLNDEQEAKKIVIHGVSLGGATTLQTLTLGGLNVDGLGTLPNISTKNVVGVIDDCGYTSMTGIILGLLPNIDSNNSTGSSDNDISTFKSKSQSIFGKDFKSSAFDRIIKSGFGLSEISLEGLIKTILTGNIIKTGLNKDNYDHYQDAFGYGRKADPNVKVMIVHGQADTTVSFENSETVENNVGNNVVETFYPQSGPHAFIIVGLNKNEYTTHVNNFLNKINMKSSETENNNTNNNDDDKSNNSGGILEFFRNLFS